MIAAQAQNDGGDEEAKGEEEQAMLCFYKPVLSTHRFRAGVLHRLSPRKICLLCLLVVCFMINLPHAAAQQVLEGRWVDAAEERIDDIRKTRLRVIVLDTAGRPIQNAKVRINQQRHDFPIGFTLPDARWPRAMNSDAPLWRCFNSLSLDPLTSWPSMSPERDAPLALDTLEKLTREARHAGIMLRFGGMISADMGRNPAWFGELDRPEQQRALENRLHETLREVPGRIAQFDLYTHALDHDDIEQAFGMPALRSLYERAHALAPQVSIGVRVRDSLLGARLRDMTQRITAMRQAFVPFDFVAIEHRTSQQLVRGSLQRAFESLENMHVSVMLASLEVGGASEAAAAFNLQVLLRTAFASPAVEGIWFGPLTAEHTVAEHAALLTADGELTPPGEVVDRFFHETWRTDLHATTDSLGNVHASVFAGIHHITATLPNGRTLSMTVHVPMNDSERVVFLESGRKS